MDVQYRGILGPRGFTRGSAVPVGTASKFKTHTWILFKVSVQPWAYTFLDLPRAQYDAAFAITQAVRLLNRRIVTPEQRSTIVVDVTNFVREATPALPPVTTPHTVTTIFLNNDV